MVCIFHLYKEIFKGNLFLKLMLSKDSVLKEMRKVKQTNRNKSLRTIFLDPLELQSDSNCLSSFIASPSS